MKCSKVRKNLLLFFDNEVSDKQQMAIKNHLEFCQDCSRQAASIERVWRWFDQPEFVEPSPHLWNKISLKLDEFKIADGFISAIEESVLRYGVPIIATAVLLLAILAGIYMGNFPAVPAQSSTSQPGLTIEDQQFVKDSYLEVFNDFPAESLGDIYVTLETQKDKR